ncbi:Proteasome subunit beta type-7, partial [Modicella reniformis]
MDHFPNNWGNPRSEDVDSRVPHGVTQIAVLTGTSVIGVKYKGGVMMAADNLASFGSLARFRNIERLHKVADFTVLGATGDLSDYQYIQHLLDSQMIKEYSADDGHTLATPNIYEYLWRIMYNRRTKMNPLWNTFVLGGVHE